MADTYTNIITNTSTTTTTTSTVNSTLHYFRRWRHWETDWQGEDPAWRWARWPTWANWHPDDQPAGVAASVEPTTTAQETALELCGVKVLATVGGCSVAVRRHLHADSSTVWSHSDGEYSAVLVKVVFHVEVLGHSELVLGSLHIHNVAAKKPMVSQWLLESFFQACATHHADLVGYDANQASVRIVTLAPPGSVFLRPPLETDCTGMWVPQWSCLLDDTIRLHGAKFFNAAQVDLGLRETDSDSHYLLAGIWRLTGVPRVRNPATKKAARKRQQEAQRDRAKAAASSSSAAP